MHSLTQEIRSFSRKNLKKQCTRVTTLTGKRIIETWKDARMQVVEEAEPSDGFGCGYVQDLSLDLQVGVIKPWLLLGSQDAAQDLETMKKYGVTHVLNVAYGVENAFPNDFIYKNISILDLPETDITSYFPECFEFIEQAKMLQMVLVIFLNGSEIFHLTGPLARSQTKMQASQSLFKDGVVLVHCNAGVSRAAAIIIGFLINSEGLNFARAFSWVKNARPAICPNPGFMEQLHKYQECSKKANGSINDHK
ncbi:dual specificity protein phosphatase 19 isoform X1 [Terrapene carolina triunguis]|uniref:Dual specificity phosphatase 19 n=1 Tax=Terrapene triunguis TaxID=2587831 RepID=A0A674K000_9SAUR|nr:dual specificity protein phosphatase 19 isoform X1 [Terrapene carolina triunguis]